LTEHVRFVKGGEGVIVAIDGEHVTLSSTTSAPPGAYVDATLDDGTPIRMKVRGCKRRASAGEEDATRFDIEGRIIDLSRALRERLAKP